MNLFLLISVGAPTAVGLDDGLPEVDNYAHSGGLFVGFFSALVLFGTSPGSCCCAEQLPPICHTQPPAVGETRDGAIGVLLLKFTRLGNLQRFALGFIVVYFVALSAALVAVKVEDQVISC